MRKRHLTLVEGGSTNSRPNDRSVAFDGSGCDWFIDQVGVDTVRFRWRGDGFYTAMRGVCQRSALAGEVWDQQHGFRFGAFPSGLVYAEARVAAMVDGTEAQYLARPAQVAEAAVACSERLLEMGLRVPAQPSVGRIDVAGQFSFADGGGGAALLHGLAGLDLPWLKRGTEGGKGGRIETVLWRTMTGRSTHLRGYCKATEADLGPYGSLVRVERQLRFRKNRERYLSHVINEPLSGWFGRRYLDALLAGSQGHQIVTLASASAVLLAHVDAGRISWGQYETLLGFLCGASDRAPLRTWQRRWSKLRSLGVHLAAETPGLLLSPLPEQLRALRSALEAA